MIHIKILIPFSLILLWREACCPLYSWPHVTSLLLHPPAMRLQQWPPGTGSPSCASPCPAHTSVMTQPLTPGGSHPPQHVWWSWWTICTQAFRPWWRAYVQGKRRMNWMEWVSNDKTYDDSWLCSLLLEERNVWPCCCWGQGKMWLSNQKWSLHPNQSKRWSFPTR